MPWSTEFNKSVDQDVISAGEVIEHIDARNYRLNPSKTQDKVGEFIRAYSHPGLLNISAELRAAFAYSLTQYWYRPSNMYNLFQTIPVAVLIGSGYVLDIDTDEMGKAVEGEYYQDPTGTWFDMNMPVAYEEHLNEWPEIKKLQSLSLRARFAFVRTLQYLDLGVGLADFQRVHPREIPYLRQGLRELVRAGLIGAKPDIAELLMWLTVKDLKQLAADEGIKVYGRKSELARSLAEQLGEERIAAYLSEKNISNRHLRPNVTNSNSLKKYIWAETRRLELYVRWIEKVECLKESPPKRAVSPTARDEEEDVFRTDPLAPDPYEPGNLDPVEIRKYAENHPTEIRLVRNIWDANCDGILRKLVEMYRWYAARFICDAIEEYLPASVLQSFVDECAAHRTSNWNWVLTYAGEARILELGIEVPEPRLLTCAGCNIKFREWSIGWSIRERVGQKILFCNECYQVACFHDGRAKARSTDAEEMLARLRHLVEVLETIPTASFMRRPGLATLSEDKQTSVVRALLDTPPYAEYVSQFGSWFQALNKAGVLQDGQQMMSRGYRCIANDGHECYSIPEKMIDDWLSTRQIDHEKEPLYPFDSEINPSGLRADWQVGDVLIEYAGMMDDPEYAMKMQNKQELASKYNVPLVVLEPEDLLSLDERLSELMT